mgnify:CR=1 FL=1
MMLTQLIKLSRVKKQLIMQFTDCILIILILLLSFSIRLGYLYLPKDDLIWVIIIGAPIIAVPIFAYFGLYLTVVRYIGFKALWSIVQAVSLYSLVWGIVGLMIMIDSNDYVLPRSLILINWMLSILCIGGVRLAARFLFSNNFVLNGKGNNLSSNKRCRVLIYGAGDSGIQLVSALESSSEYQLIGFIDDSKGLKGHQIRGLNVYSTHDIDNLKVDEVLIAMPSISRLQRLSIINKLEPFQVIVRILPSVLDMAQGKLSIDDLREVNIKDLLGRNIAPPNKELLGKNITDQVVMITGAGGSIGAELSRQVLLLKPKALILYETNEFALYTIEKELSSNNYHSIDIYPILGNVNNKSRLISVFKSFDIDTIYHAAAYKHVPIVEFNNTEGVENNIFGTLNCAQLAIKSNVNTFVLISTDKAVRPTNTMGATKRTAELILQALSAKGCATKFSMVRFGNVLGSSGSVIPLFKQQIKEGGPITVTDKDIIRYFMTIPEAVELVIQAGAMSLGGDVFILDMGEPVRILDLAKKMISLSGLELKNKDNPEGDIEIKYTGLRAGEKLYEELLIGENVSPTVNPLIMRAEEDMLPWNELKPILDELSANIHKADHEKIRKLLIEIVPGFKPHSEISDILYHKL